MGRINSLLKAKILLIIFGTFVAVCAVYLAIDRYIIYPKFARLERQEAAKNMERFRQAIDHELSTLYLMSGDWASWDDTYAYVQAPRAEYEETNLIDETFTFSEIQLLFIINQANEIVWGKIFDPAYENEISLAEFRDKPINPDHPIFQFEPKGDLKKMNRTGILSSEHGPLFISSTPILKSNDDGPVKGTFVVGKFISEAVLEKFKSQVRGPLALLFPDALDPETYQSLAAHIKRHNGIFIETGKESLSVYSAYSDIRSAPAFLVKTEFPREITRHGEAALRTGLIIMLVTTFVVMVILQLLLGKSILRPIAKLTRFTRDLQADRDFTRRLAIDRADEIGTLADGMNDMVGTITERTDELIRVNLELKHSLDEIKTLRGILPICSKCKKIRDDEGYWNYIESYIEKHSEAAFSHGLCPGCCEEMYGHEQWFPELEKKREETENRPASRETFPPSFKKRG